MPEQTNLNVAPFFDDFKEQNNFVKTQKNTKKISRITQK